MTIRNRVFWSCVKLSFAVCASVSVAIPSFAAFDDDDDAPAVRSSARQEAVKRKAYAGARDEQDLKVQPSLPQPSRYPDGASGESTEAGQPQLPHDTD